MKETHPDSGSKRCISESTELFQAVREAWRILTSGKGQSENIAGCGGCGVVHREGDLEEMRQSLENLFQKRGQSKNASERFFENQNLAREKVRKSWAHMAAKRTQKKQ